MLKQYLSSFKNKIYHKKDFEIYDKSILPPRNRRFNGGDYNDNAYYIQSAEAEARRVITRLGCHRESRILEIGCSTGRFAIGLLRLLGPVRYTGLDVCKSSIEWCKRYIESKNPSYHFEHLDVASERYNKNGNRIDESFKFSIEDGSIDLIYVFGVFTNMDEHTIKIYLNDFKRMLAPGGRVFLTAFVEENVPDVSVNPKGYLFEEYHGPLHVVRFEKNYIFSLISRAGLVIDEFNYGTEYDGQSVFYLE